MRALILEDDMLIGLELEEELRGQGHDVRLVSTIEEAERAIAAADFNFAILDANIDGQVPRALAELLLQRNLPFAYVTGYDEKFIREHLPDAPFLAKPVSPTVLNAMITNLIGPRE